MTNTASSAVISDVLTGSFSRGSSLLAASGYLGVGFAPGVNSGATLQAQLSTANAGTFNGTATRSLLTCQQKCPFIPV
ncbi:MAG TPA: hypothetical protein VFG29_06455 [Syntrophales bacterium]|nr:hypothetical protein [Syntrophales bacterium]